jgi:hypothetical protein
MVPQSLRPESFAHYPPQARSFAVTHLDVLKRVSPVLAPLILRQMIQYDWLFPAEREQLSGQMSYLGGMSADAFRELMQPFSSIPLSNELAQMDWVNRPQEFSERLTAYLWSQHTIDSYHRAAQDYQRHLEQAIVSKKLSTPRWTMVVVGQGTRGTDRELFRRLRPHATLLTQVDPRGGFDALFERLHDRAKQYPLEYGHWYIEGGEQRSVEDRSVTRMSYSSLVPYAKRELDLLRGYNNNGSSVGSSKVESISSFIAGLTPEAMGMRGSAEDAPLRHFEANVLTQGAGCQIFSTTFVQWSARECLHRAQPLTLLARFGTRQVNAPMEELLTRDPLAQAQDEEGSLVDGEMGAYYTWINQSRLPGAEDARFIAWHEGHKIACVIAPKLPAGKTSEEKVTMKDVLDWML